MLRNLNHPVYVVSKGRHDNFQTPKIFEKFGIKYFIVVEPQEASEYKKKIRIGTVVETPFANLGLGSFPARNFAWDHSLSIGASAHFVFDDNIASFATLNGGKRKYCQDPFPALKCAEDFLDRYHNLAICGFNYAGFVTRETRKPFQINTHVYSGMLIRNKTPYRWRLKYNEDVDLCLQILNSKKWCTVLLNAYLIDKTSTGVKMKGGNQTELYKNNDPHKKTLKAKSLEMMWPQYAKTVVRFGRPHHFVDWKKHFNHSLERKAPTNGKTA